jgi:hypothetical protein
MRPVLILVAIALLPLFVPSSAAATVDDTAALARFGWIATAAWPGCRARAASKSASALA